MTEEYSLLEKTIEYLCAGHRFHISLYDITGISKKVRNLILPSKYRAKHFPFCIFAKSTPRGHALCKRVQHLAVARARREKEPHLGQCHLGLWSLRVPVFWYGTMVAVIFVSNICRPGTLEEAEASAEKAEKYTGIPAADILEKMKTTTERTDAPDTWLTAAEICRAVILSVLETENYKAPTERENYRLKEVKKNNILDSILEECNRNYAENLSITEFARQYYLHPDYLARLFKKEVGLTFSAYLNTLRIRKARKMLYATDDKIVDIAYSVGYTSDAYFIRMFKKVQGETPLQYRKRSRHES